MLLTKETMNVVKITAKDATRYQIDGVLLERVKDKARAVATDGQRMLIVEWVDADDTRSDGFRTILSEDAIKTLRGMMPKGKVTAENYVAIDETSDDDSVRVCAGDEEKTVTVKPLKGLFPKYREAIPQPDVERQKYTQWGCNPKLFGELLLAMDAAMGKRDQKTVKLSIPLNGHKGILIESVSDEGSKVIGVLAPVSLTKYEKKNR